MKDINEYSKSTKVKVIALFAIIFGIYIAYGIIQQIQAKEKSLNLVIEGEVQHVYYDIKGFPIVTINSKEIFIDVLALNHKIEVGDFLSKRKGSNTYRLIKKGSEKVKDFSW